MSPQPIPFAELPAAFREAKRRVDFDKADPSRPCRRCGRCDGLNIVHDGFRCRSCGLKTHAPAPKRPRCQRTGPAVVYHRPTTSTARPRQRATRPVVAAGGRDGTGERDDGGGDGDGGAYPPPQPDVQAAFALRAWARAYLFQIGEFDLHDAVDVLQADAMASGLVAAIGQDAVQLIIARAFDAVRVDAPLDTVPEGISSYDEDVASEPRAAASTCSAVLYALRHGGKAALARQAERLCQLSIKQMESLIAALSKLGASEDLLVTLAELLP